VGKRENKVENYLDERVKEFGGITRKWCNPYHQGVPDRICLFNHGLTVFVEVKTDDGELSPVQQREHDRIRARGHEVHAVYGHNGVDKLIEDLKARYGASFT
jgi:hypothetical protein